MKPTIGITCKKRHIGMQDYIDAVTRFGGEPQLFVSLEKSISEHLTSIPEYLEQINGLLLPGGGDIDPGRYSQERHGTVKNVSRSRDALEIQLCQKALKADIPVFGICRGIQVMSIATGGSLYQDIKDVYSQDALTHKIREGDFQHKIKVKSHSRLNEIVDENSILVNSAHHQAVDMIGEGFVKTAHTEDGIVEAMEIPSRRFVIGVQYHPERMLKESGMREHAEKLFIAFVNAASAMM